MEDRSPQLLGVSCPLLAISIITFALRLWVRWFSLKTWGIDDWLITVSLASFTIYVISECVGISHGTGKHIRDLEPDDAQTALVTWWVCELCYVITTVFLKLSVGVFLHRIAINRWHIWIIRLMTVCTGIFGFAYLFVGIFTCWPVQAWWIRKHALTSKDYGSCIPDVAVVGMTYAAGSLNSIADFTYGLIPFFIIKDLHMPKKSKRLVAAILAFANIACIATIIRMPYVLDLYHTSDWLYATANLVTWCEVEIGVGITAANIATLRPLLRILFGVHTSSWFPEQHSNPRIDKYYTSNANNQSSSNESYNLKSSVGKLRPDAVGHYTEISSAGSRQSRGRPRERRERDPRITGRAMRDLYTNDDEEQEEQLRNSVQEPPRSTPVGERDGARSPLEIRKNFEFTTSVEERKEDDMDDKRWSPPPAQAWQSEAAARYVRDVNARTANSMEQARRSEEGSLNLPLQTHGLDLPEMPKPTHDFTLPLQTHGMDK